ncbi:MULTISPECIES: cytidine deaminase [unclassified Roseitalea]|uniref:cytidine deaminase n=1 Tax=unclassified Roseitalea TaxID=2639107 RepID=UPI00273F11E8|nr:MULTISPECIES: cytidine deaminase [unclassified Roseitalea]
MADLAALYRAAIDAMGKSRATYSRFPVGAAILTADGAIHAGGNIEVVSYPEGWCAETTALSHYVMAGGGEITDICVLAEKLPLCTPCGGCRQRLAEFAPPHARVHLCDAGGIARTIALADLLPLAFDTDVLRP